jgi:hypothetical protein
VIFRIARESWSIWDWECVEGSLFIQKIGPLGASNAEMKACLLVRERGREGEGLGLLGRFVWRRWSGGGG